tara:strand:+ start:146 stop:700 length:555 start_codon:yes stop_codon:yes gene_type:complete
VKFSILKYQKLYIILLISFTHSCTNWDKSELKTNSKEDPISISFDVRMVYTDSLQINSILTAPVHEDYRNLFLKYSIFPDGLKLIFYDNFGCPNTIEADYATIYKDTSILNFVGNVKITSSSGDYLETSQLYWDAESDWFFNNKNFKFWNSDYDVDARRLDANKQFTKFNTGRLTGTMSVEERQ